MLLLTECRIPAFCTTSLQATQRVFESTPPSSRLLSLDCVLHRAAACCHSTVYSTEQPPAVTRLCTPPSSRLLSLDCVLHRAAACCHSTVYCTEQPPAVTRLCTAPSSRLLSLDCVLHRAAACCHSTVYCTEQQCYAELYALCSDWLL